MRHRRCASTLRGLVSERLGTRLTVFIFFQIPRAIPGSVTLSESPAIPGIQLSPHLHNLPSFFPSFLFSPLNSLSTSYTATQHSFIVLCTPFRIRLSRGELSIQGRHIINPPRFRRRHQFCIPCILCLRRQVVISFDSRSVCLTCSTAGNRQSKCTLPSSQPLMP